MTSSPCCGDEVRLLFSPYRHRGYPRRDDRTADVYTVRCDRCDRLYDVVVAVRLHRVNPDRTGWSTYASPLWPTWLERS